MKNCLSILLMMTLVFSSGVIFSQPGTDPEYRHFAALNMAPVIGHLADNAGFGNVIGLGYKYQWNKQYKLRVMAQFEKDPMSYNAAYFVFADTVMTFLNRGTDVQDWRVSAGFEKGKFYRPFYWYWGVQAAFGMKESSYQNDLSGYLSSSDFTSLPLMAGDGYARYGFNYSPQADTIVFTANIKQTRIALGVPMGFGIKILKHVELQVELATELGYTNTDYTKERFESKEISVIKTHSFDFDIRQFQLLLGWKF